MLSYLRLRSAAGTVTELHETATRAVSRVEGILGIANVREVVRARPTGHGTINDSRYVDEDVITIEGEVWGASIEAAHTEFDLIAGAMFDTLEAPATLEWRRGTTGEQLQAQVKLASPVLPPIEGGGARLVYQAQFRAPDPRSYSQTQTTTTGATLSVAAGGKVYPYTYPRTYNASSGGTAAVTNAGSLPTPPILRIYGRAVSPRVRLASTGEEIVFTGEVLAGDYLEVDVANRTVKLNGTTSRLSMVDFTASTWWTLPKGASTVQLLASAFDTNARVDVIHRAAYT